MAILDTRSKNQVLFNVLPEQTVDLKSRIWKVTEWIEPEPVDVDMERLRQHLIGEIKDWRENGRDNGLAEWLWKRYPLEVRALDTDRGVRVERFPNWYECRSCHVVSSDDSKRCPQCGKKQWGQMHFVGYHECGQLFEPWVTPCPTHKLMQVVSPGTAKAGQIYFTCPNCSWKSRPGLGVRPCNCGRSGVITYTVHRAASVYSPQTTMMINPPSKEALAELSDAGGPKRALRWVVEGMPGKGPEAAEQTAEDIEAKLAGVDPAMREIMMGALQEHGDVKSAKESDDFSDVPDELLERAESEAVEAALGVRGSRVTTEDLGQRPMPSSVTSTFTREYPNALTAAGLAGVDLVDQFPIFRGVYGYVRGEPSASVLQPFRGKKAYRVHADVGQTEALLVRLNPVRVLGWLRSEFPELPDASDEREARRALLSHSRIPNRFEEVSAPTVGSRVAELVHTYAHRLIRQTAVFSGIDREALAEFLLPSHCAFFLYAQPRGEFVLGGLQAVFEDELHRLLNTFLDADPRCALDPGCERMGAACPACLHLGEPSCRWFNRHLSRERLFGSGGYLSLASES